MTNDDIPPGTGEFDLIRRYFAPLSAGLDGAYSLLDDAGRLPDVPIGHERVVTSDCLIAGVHFPSEATPAQMATKAMGANLSDLAAMGAVPAAYTLALVLPKDLSDKAGFCSALASELAELQTRYDVHLLGGDTVASPGPCTVSITAFGDVPAGQVLRRSGARPGDHVYVSGTIGDGALGLLAEKGHLPEIGADTLDSLLAHYHAPCPRLGVGRALRGLATSALDVSDGLLADLGHLSRASKVRIEIESGLVPLSEAVKAVVSRDQHLFDLVLTGGDDYELAFTGPERLPDELAGVPITRIGSVVAGEGVGLVDSETPAQTGYRHF